MFFAYIFKINQLPSIQSPISLNFIPTPTPTPRPKIISSPGLTSAVNKALEGTKGTYGIIIKNLKTGESYCQNENRIFEPASLYKLWIMGTVFDQIKKGKFTEDLVLTADVSYLNKKFGITDDASGIISLTVHEALEKMITVSDNYAALILTDKVTLSAVTNYLKDNNFNDSKVGGGTKSPLTSPADIASLPEKLYKGQLASPEYSSKMLELLRLQRLNGGLPKYLPESVTFAHKTGELEPFTHDAGIAYTGMGDYIIVVFSETDSRELAQERIALVSKEVYNYFTQTPQ